MLCVPKVRPAFAFVIGIVGAGLLVLGIDHGSWLEIVAALLCMVLAAAGGGKAYDRTPRTWREKLLQYLGLG